MTSGHLQRKALCCFKMPENGAPSYPRKTSSSTSASWGRQNCHDGFCIPCLQEKYSSVDRLLPLLPFSLFPWLHYPRRISVSSVAVLQPPLSCATCLQLTIPSFLIWFLTSSFHLALCLPLGHLWCTFAWYIFLEFLASSIRCRCPIHLRRPM